MSIFGDLSQPQRAHMAMLFARKAFSIDTAVYSRPAPQLREALSRKGLADAKCVDVYRWSCWLTPAGTAVMRELDFRHCGGSRQRRSTYST